MSRLSVLHDMLGYVDDSDSVTMIAQWFDDEANLIMGNASGGKVHIIGGELMLSPIEWADEMDDWDVQP